MKVLCVIDHFGTGGAQRQMVNLACGLKRRGHDVGFFVYFPQYAFFRNQVQALGIPIYEYPKGNGFSLATVRKLASLIRSRKTDIVVSFLDNPNLYSELSSLFAPRARFVVSERSSHFGDKSATESFLRRNMHRLANSVVTNSFSHQRWLENNHPWLKGLCTTIYNGLDVALFRDQPELSFAREDIRLIGIGRVGPEKNLLALVNGLNCFLVKHGWVPSISWVGRRDETVRRCKTYGNVVDELLDAMPEVKESWSWLGERADIPALLSHHHALILPSLYEGLPNVICEALTAGRPVLASNVCDNALLVSEGTRGFLFDPNSAESIAGAIERVVALQPNEWNRMSQAARQYAGEMLTIDRMVTGYERLFERLLENAR